MAVIIIKCIILKTTDFLCVTPANEKKKKIIIITVLMGASISMFPNQFKAPRGW